MFCASGDCDLLLHVYYVFFLPQAAWQCVYVQDFHADGIQSFHLSVGNSFPKVQTFIKKITVRSQHMNMVKNALVHTDMHAPGIEPHLLQPSYVVCRASFERALVKSSTEFEKYV